MNKIVAVSVAAAVPTNAPAMPITASLDDQKLEGFHQFRDHAGRLWLKADDDDPIFAAIEAYRRADAACASAPGGDIPAELSDRLSGAYDAVLKTRPTTPAGLSVLTTWARVRTDWIHAQGSLWITEHLCTLFSTLDDATRGMSGLKPWSPRPAGTKTKAEDIIERCRKGNRRWDALYTKLERAEAAAREKLGKRPFICIQWRNFLIGESELDRTRDTFIARGEDDPAAIESEYRAWKKQCRATARAARDWDRKAGLKDLRAEYDNNRSETRANWKALGKVPLTSTRDAVAIIGLLRERMNKYDELSDDWEVAAFKNASRFLVRATA